MRKKQKYLWFLMFALVLGSFFYKPALAEETGATEEQGETNAGETPEVQPEGKIITLGTQEDVTLDYDETGKFVLDIENEASAYTAIKDRISSVKYECTNDEADPDQILELSEDGTYHTAGFGEVELTVHIYDIFGIECLMQIYTVHVQRDMESVKLSKTTFTGKVVIYSEEEKEFTTKVIGMEGLGEDTYGLTLKSEYTNNDMDVETSFEEGVLHFTVHGIGTTEGSIWINEKEFTVTIKVKEIKLSGSTAFYLVKGKSKQLKIKNLGKKKVSFKSTNEEVAKVTDSGLIQAKKSGNAVIIATVDGHNFGCAISVLTKIRKKLVTRAKYIGTHWKYSQPKRMKKYFYDCSSLVWKCYRLEKQYFGDKYYAPVAASIAKYCANHKKNVKGNIAKNIQKMKYLPGALLFKTGKKNGRYRGIYHVEMFVGYTFEGVDNDGTPILGTRWGARDDNYDYRADNGAVSYLAQP